MTLSRDQIISLSPDSASIKAAEKLLNPAQWPLLQFNDKAIWGECQGSGANPYQSRIDLSGPAFKCSCPSRKFPCKHGLALFLLFDERKQAFTEMPAPPPWVAEWLESRVEKAHKKAESATTPKQVDEAAQARREDKRQQRVEQGLFDLQRWLEDVARVGLADLQGKNYAYWDHLAARLIDAQAAGLAFRVRRLGEQVMRGAPHHDIAAPWAELALLVEAALRLASLPLPLQEDIRSQLGWTQNQDELLKQPAHSDHWWIWSHQQQVDDKLIRQDIVVQGQHSGRFARLLNYAHPTQRSSLLQGWMPGHCYEANAYFYPGTLPLRAIMANPSRLPDPTPPAHATSLSLMISRHQQQLLEQPWLGERPCLVDKVTPILIGDQLQLQGDGVLVKARLTTRACWQLLALSGGGPLTMFGEWDGDIFLPISVVVNQQLHSLHTTFLGEA